MQELRTARAIEPVLLGRPYGRAEAGRLAWVAHGGRASKR
jgi:hypothetical protein